MTVVDMAIELPLLVGFQTAVGAGPEALGRPGFGETVVDFAHLGLPAGTVSGACLELGRERTVAAPSPPIATLGQGST